jgi:hypothetical protein
MWKWSAWPQPSPLTNKPGPQQASLGPGSGFRLYSLPKGLLAHPGLQSTKGQVRGPGPAEAAFSSPQQNKRLGWGVGRCDLTAEPRFRCLSSLLSKFQGHQVRSWRQSPGQNCLASFSWESQGRLGTWEGLLGADSQVLERPVTQQYSQQTQATTPPGLSCSGCCGAETHLDRGLGLSGGHQWLL